MMTPSCLPGLGLLAALLLPLPAAAQSVLPTAPMFPPAVPASPLRTYALRLRPGQDLRQELENFVVQHQLRAAAVLTCVGSLTHATLRLANQEGGTEYRGHFEIVSLVGTLALSGSHLHLSLADSTGRVVGGHLLAGSRVYTTAELIIGELPALEFRRETDPVSTYQELVVYPAPAPAPRRPKK